MPNRRPHPQDPSTTILRRVITYMIRREEFSNLFTVDRMYSEIHEASSGEVSTLTVERNADSQYFTHTYANRFDAIRVAYDDQFALTLSGVRDIDEYNYTVIEHKPGSTYWKYERYKIC